MKIIGARSYLKNWPREKVVKKIKKWRLIIKEEAVFQERCLEEIGNVLNVAKKLPNFPLNLAPNVLKLFIAKIVIVKRNLDIVNKNIPAKEAGMFF